MIRVLIADDHLVVRQGLQMILNTEDDFEVVGGPKSRLEGLRQGLASRSSQTGGKAGASGRSLADLAAKLDYYFHHAYSSSNVNEIHEKQQK